VRGRRLLCPDKSLLAMTKSKVLDEAGDYKNLEVKYEDNT
jgi:hypothetical protein